MAGNLLNHYLKPSESSKNASADDVLRAFDLVLLTEVSSVFSKDYRERPRAEGSW